MAERRNIFAVNVKSADDVPKKLQSIYTEALQKGSSRLSLYAPPLDVLPAEHKADNAGYVLMVFDEDLVIGVDRGGEEAVEKVEVRLDNLIFVELGEVLLFSWMKIVYGPGAAREIKILFNAVGGNLFLRALLLMRRTIDRHPLKGLQALPDIPDVPFKFRSALQYFLAPEEALIEVTFQPEIRETHWIYFEHQVIPPLLVALTDRELLLITEERPVAGERLGQYSDIFTYCPLSRVHSLNIQRTRAEDNLLSLELTLVNRETAVRLEWTVGADLESRLALLCQVVNRLTSVTDPKNGEKHY